MNETHHDRQYHILLSHYLISHGRAIAQACHTALCQPFRFLFTVLLLAIMMIPPFVFYLAQNNIAQIAEHPDSMPTISLYLKPGTSTAKIEHLLTRLKHDSSIFSAQYISPRQGLQELSQTSQLKDLLTYVDHNPLPSVINLKPKFTGRSAKQVNDFYEQLKQIPEVAHAQMDTALVEKLYTSRYWINNIALGISAFFLLGAIIILIGELRANLGKKQYELSVLRSLGANSRYLRRPFLYQGFLLGAVSALVACRVLYLVCDHCNSALLSLENIHFLGLIPNWQQIGLLTLGMAFLGALLARFLKLTPSTR